MNQYTVTYSSQAVNDLVGIHAYITYDLFSPINAVNQTNRIKKAIRKLAQFPNSHPIVEYEQWDSLKLHRLNVDNYLVFYFIDEIHKNVDISRIVYGGMDISKI